MDIVAALEKRILVLDGAMGTMIQNSLLEEADFRGDRFMDHPCALKGNNDLLSITKPELIKNIHLAYLEAGADIIETNTFSSTSIGMADYQMEALAYELNFESAKIGKEAVLIYNEKTPDQPRFVAGSIGPTNKTASMSPDVNDPGYRAIDFDTWLRPIPSKSPDLLMEEQMFYSSKPFLTHSMPKPLYMPSTN